MRRGQSHRKDAMALAEARDWRYAGEVTQPDHAVVESTIDEPTLAAILTRAVRTTFPTRLYQLLQLALPLAVEFALQGWWRPAVGAMSLTAFGMWGLADRWLWQASGEGPQLHPETLRLMKIGRAVAGTVAATGAGLVMLELFLRLLGAAPTF